MQPIISQSLIGTAPDANFADLQARLIDYACRIGELGTPNDVLDALHVVTWCEPMRWQNGVAPASKRAREESEGALIGRVWGTS